MALAQTKQADVVPTVLSREKGMVWYLSYGRWSDGRGAGLNYDEGVTKDMMDGPIFDIPFIANPPSHFPFTPLLLP